MNFLIEIFTEAWDLFVDSSVYMLFGIAAAGLIRVFLDPGAVARHLGRGRFSSVIKAALMGIPIPLCSCGVLPAAVSLKKQGASKGATVAFLISTPESGIDSIAITYALLDPIMTIARPIAAFATAAAAGLAENVVDRREETGKVIPDLSCPVDRCCSGIDCPPTEHRNHHSISDKFRAGFRYSVKDLWPDIALWFFLGLLLAGLITTLIPPDLLTGHLGGGLPAMLIMLAIGIPLYICATASTPVAAALVLGGISPGAALVFLLTGPATNVTSLTMLVKVLGKRATVIYLLAIAVCSVLFGLLLDWVYLHSGISAKAIAGQAAEIMPEWARTCGAMIILALSVKPVLFRLRSLIPPRRSNRHFPSCACPDGSILPKAEVKEEDCNCGS